MQLNRSAWKSWSEWKRLSEVDWKTIPSGPGVYVIAVKRKLHRALGSDEEGILDIGQSKRLRSRLRRFWLCAGDSNLTGHMAGWRFAHHKM